MVLDPLTALGFASNVVQFVDSGVRFVAAIREIHKSTTGLSSHHAQLLSTVDDFRQLSESLLSAIPTTAHRSLSKNEEAMKRPATSCKHLADEIVAMLVGLKAEEPRRRLNSFRQALRGVSRRGRIVEATRKMEALKGDVSIYLLAVLRYIQSMDLVSGYLLTKSCAGMNNLASPPG